jgi:hypothetical protein
MGVSKEALGGMGSEKGLRLGERGALKEIWLGC